MKNFSIGVHGGAGDDSEFIHLNHSGYKKGLEDAVNVGYKILKQGGSALGAVENAVRFLENNPLFNAGRGSALNNKGEVEMDASIMDGRKNSAGAVSLVRNVKNPITLARYIMENTAHVFLSGQGALEIAHKGNMELEVESYFITEHQVNEFTRLRNKDDYNDMIRKRLHGTVGAVALDKEGNLAAATSTGGIGNCLNGRVGDSCVIGAGCYANNSSCAVSGTGEGELLINNVIAYSIAFYKELKDCSLQDACDHVIHQRIKNAGDIGVIAVDAQGNIGICFNSQRMHRAWKINEDNITVKIYQ